MNEEQSNQPPTPDACPGEGRDAKDGEQSAKAPSSLEEGVGGGGVSRDTLQKRAREMRNNPTEPEKRLWHALKGKRLSRFKFRRQHVIGHRIVDFYCSAVKLAVEVDGETHNPTVDAEKDQRMACAYGVKVMRFTNDDVMRNLEGVTHVLNDELAAANHPPTPSLGRRGSC